MGCLDRLGIDKGGQEKEKKPELCEFLKNQRELQKKWPFLSRKQKDKILRDEAPKCALLKEKCESLERIIAEDKHLTKKEWLDFLALEHLIRSMDKFGVMTMGEIAIGPTQGSSIRGTIGKEVTITINKMDDNLWKRERDVTPGPKTFTFTNEEIVGRANELGAELFPGG